MKNRLLVIIDSLLVGMFFFLVNIRSFIFWFLYPDTTSLYGNAWTEILLWLFVLILCFYLIKKHNLLQACLLLARKNPLIWLFALYALLSISWSDSWTVTAHRSLVFLFALLITVYIVARYSLEEIFDILFWVGITAVLANLLMVFVIPSLGRDFHPPYNGAWRGLFWHKNQLGNIVPVFILVFLGEFFILTKKKLFSRRALAVFFYLLSLMLIYFSKSASGYILVILVHFVFVLTFAWFKTRHLLRPQHYYLALGAFAFAAVVILLNLNSVLGIFGRDSSFTGRVPLWTALVRDVFSRRPWLGYGFGTVWANTSLRLELRNSLGWLYPVLIGDNGFLDILLNLGVIGFGVFLLNYLTAWVFSIRLLYNLKSLVSVLPFVFMVYTFFANLTFSLFMETEMFVWSLIVIFWLSASKNLNEL